MTEAESLLWERLKCYQIDEPGVASPFSRRLASEQGWSESFSRRVIEEYKRFCFLAVTLPDGASPSAIVDEAWHLHLTYTREYWQKFCPDILGKSLHHVPTRGGALERRKHDDWYESTRAAYQRLFGMPPPLDIWPPEPTQVSHVSRKAKVDIRQCWVIPKPKWISILERQHWPVTLAVAPVALFATLDPFELHGPEFLVLYSAALVIACIVLWCVHRSVIQRNFIPPQELPSMKPFDIAMLNDNRQNAIDAAIMSLIHKNVVVLVGSGESPPVNALQSGGITTVKQATLFRECSATVPKDPIEAHCFGLIAVDRGTELKSVTTNMCALAQQSETRLIQLGLLATNENQWRYRSIVTAVFAVLVVSGILKIAIGVGRHKPVFFLCVLVGLAIFIGIKCAFRNMQTDLGWRLIDEYRREFTKLMRIDSSKQMELDSHEIAMGVALFGVSCLATGPYSRYRDELQAAAMKQTGSSDSGGGCSSGDGCGGGGCGGCGGGD
jgi:uncharacterized protein (TIGR04222 family)